MSEASTSERGDGLSIKQERSASEGAVHSLSMRWIRNTLCFIVTFLIVLPVQGQRIGIEARSPNSISIILPQVDDAWLRLQRRDGFGAWRTAAEPLFGLEEFSVPSGSEGLVMFRFERFMAPEPPYTIGVLGDSTASGVFFDGRLAAWSWIEELRLHAKFDTRIVSSAEPGLSTKNVLNSRRTRLELIGRLRPEFVLIQLGQLDFYTSDQEGKATTLIEYADNLRILVDVIRSWGGTPILVTPLPWRLFEPDGSPSNVLRDRSEVMLELGAELGLFVIDIHRSLGFHYRSVSGDELESLGAIDDFHLSEKGAKLAAVLVLNGLPKHLRDLLFDVTAN